MSEQEKESNRRMLLSNKIHRNACESLHTMYCARIRFCACAYICIGLTAMLVNGSTQPVTTRYYD